MPWQYSQRTRRLTRNGEQVGNRGYSGARPWQNDPRAEHLRDQGPIPRGQYTIGGAVDREDKGPVTMSLTPVGHNARGRTSFLIHAIALKILGKHQRVALFSVALNANALPPVATPYLR